MLKKSTILPIFNSLIFFHKSRHPFLQLYPRAMEIRMDLFSSFCSLSFFLFLQFSVKVIRSIFSRLRISHISLTHKCILFGDPPPLCLLSMLVTNFLTISTFIATVHSSKPITQLSVFLPSFLPSDIVYHTNLNNLFSFSISAKFNLI